MVTITPQSSSKEMNKYAITGTIWLVSLAATAYFVRDYVTAKHDQAVLEAVKAAIIEHDKLYKEVSRIEQKKYTDLQGVNTQLNASLDIMRRRAGRLSEAARVPCAGSTGAELSKFDGDFLTRYSAHTERFRLELKACKDYTDSIQK